MNKLSIKEALDLTGLEQMIERDKDAFIRVGKALAEIRDRKLYRKDYKDFNLYCERRWGFSGSHAYRTIDAAVAVEELRKDSSPMGGKITTERAARELVKVPRADRPKVVAHAASNGAVTGASIARAAKAVATIEMDSTGWPIPTDLASLWQRGEEVEAILHYLSKLKASLGAYQDADDPLWREVNFSAVLGDLEKAWTAIQCAKPYAVCTQCQGHPEVNDGKCKLCKGRGLISKFRYDRLVPNEIKEIRNKGMKK